MNTSDYISLLALCVSTASISLSWFFGFRDRANLRTSAILHSHNHGYQGTLIELEIVNHGRRPAILTYLVGEERDGGASAIVLGEKDRGIRLQEHEKYKITVYSHDLVIIDPEGNEHEYISYWFEDTLGRKYKVKGIRKLIEKMRN